MRFDLVRPCRDCPFRNDGVRFAFRGPRAIEIVKAIACDDLTFACHKTTGDAEDTGWQHCGGALILHEKLGRPNWRIRMAIRFGLFDPADLDMTAPVVDTVAQFLALQSAGKDEPR